MKEIEKFPTKNIIYCYDGSFEGFLCCVFESFVRKETPFAVWPPEQETCTLYRVLQIETDRAHADRVFRSIGQKFPPQAQDFIMTCFFAGDPAKEYLLLRFLQLAFTVGGRAFAMLGHPEVAPVYAIYHAVKREAHQFQGFVRFEEHEGMLGAVIRPNHYVLPLLRPHFCNRFPHENFLIYDQTHCAVLLYQDHKAEITRLCAPLQLPPADATEQYYQQLWRQFYNTVSIAARENPVCRRTHCPKRYWQNMTELRDAL